MPPRHGSSFGDPCRFSSSTLTIDISTNLLVGRSAARFFLRASPLSRFAGYSCLLRPSETNLHPRCSDHEMMGREIARYGGIFVPHSFFFEERICLRPDVLTGGILFFLRETFFLPSCWRCLATPSGLKKLPKSPRLRKFRDHPSPANAHNIFSA